jgi:RimJ/RimL family protein N-acetyltransferase
MSQAADPQIRKAALVRGKTLIFRDATVEDAALILNLRTDEKKGRFLSATSDSLEVQQAWLRAYAVSTGQAYFIIEREGQAIGTVRLYDPRGKSFCWGSWIIADGQPASVAMESALMVYAYALDCLGYEQAHFDVRAANEKVWKFHERFGAKRLRQVGDDFFYELSMDSIQLSMERYKRFLPNSITVLPTDKS